LPRRKDHLRIDETVCLIIAEVSDDVLRVIIGRGVVKMLLFLFLFLFLFLPLTSTSGILERHTSKPRRKF